MMIFFHSRNNLAGSRFTVHGYKNNLAGSRFTVIRIKSI
jgi:hypothetical protein